MSNATKCDACLRTTPDIDPKYSRKKRWGWFRFNYDSQGGSDFPMDICQECWDKLKKMGVTE